MYILPYPNNHLRHHKLHLNKDVTKKLFTFNE